LWVIVTTYGTATALLMFSLTSLLWSHLPLLKYVQLPWRWLLCLNVSLALLIIIATQTWRSRSIGYAVLFGMLVFVWHKVQPPWWDHASDVERIHMAMLSGDGYDGTDEYVPISTDGYEIDKAARKATLNGPGRAQIRIKKWDAEDKAFSVDVTEPTQLVLRLFNYPAWQALVNGHVVETRTDDTTGQMIVPVQTGANDIRIRFIRTWDRSVGGWISIAAAVIVFVLWVIVRKFNLSTSPPL
jgi:hypothetical protein